MPDQVVYTLFCKSEMHRFAGHGMPVTDNHFVRRRHAMTKSNGRDAVIKIKELISAHCLDDAIDL